MSEQEQEEGTGMYLNPEEEEEDPLSKHLDETDHELYSAQQPYSGQYHSLPNVKLPKFHGNPLEFHKFCLCSLVW